MSSLFPTRSNSGDHWFRVGRIDVTSTMFVVLSVVATWLAWVIFPSAPESLAYAPQLIGSGEFWRLFTWPFASRLGFWPVLNLFFFWYLATDLEHSIGRKPMAWLLGGVWGSLTLSTTIVHLLLGGGQALGGIALVEFAVLLVWIAEYPDRKFLFNIPAWAFGLVLVAIQILTLLTNRDFAGVSTVLLALVFVAIAARRVGLLTHYPWIPGGRQPHQRARVKAPKKSRAEAKADARFASDRDKLDALLDQINDKGLGSLSEAQRKELLKLRERLRKS